MDSRNFKLDTEWNVIHYPEKPSGFGILIIGDEGHFVNEKSCFWTQNEGKAVLLQKLKEEGYTIFYSNLYGKNWGNENAVNMARNLYEHIIRTEILNEKIHLIAEGMGTLAALKLIKEMGSSIRTAVFINPVFSLVNHLEQEKEHKFFYKKLKKELAYSFGKEEGEIEDHIRGIKEDLTEGCSIPFKVIQILFDGRAYRQAEFLKQLSKQWEAKNMPISVSYLLPEKKQGIWLQIVNFFNKNERIL